MKRPKPVTKQYGASASSGKSVTDPHVGENKVTKIGAGDKPKFRPLKAPNSTWSR